MIPIGIFVLGLKRQFVGSGIDWIVSTRALFNGCEKPLHLRPFGQISRRSRCSQFSPLLPVNTGDDHNIPLFGLEFWPIRADG